MRLGPPAAGVLLMVAVCAAQSPVSSLSQLNPWLSACDLTQPETPPDLQGTCTAAGSLLPVSCVNEGPGPPVTMTSTSGIMTDNLFHGQANRSRNTTQCLFLGDRSENGLCGLGLKEIERKLRILRLRHCSDHTVESALKTDVLEKVLRDKEYCKGVVIELLALDALAARISCEFNEVLMRYDCGQAYSIINHCEDCKVAYRRWVCSSLVPFFTTVPVTSEREPESSSPSNNEATRGSTRKTSSSGSVNRKNKTVLKSKKKRVSREGSNNNNGGSGVVGNNGIGRQKRESFVENSLTHLHRKQKYHEHDHDHDHEDEQHHAALRDTERTRININNKLTISQDLEQKFKENERISNNKHNKPTFIKRLRRTARSINEYVYSKQQMSLEDGSPNEIHDGSKRLSPEILLSSAESSSPSSEDVRSSKGNHKERRTKQSDRLHRIERAAESSKDEKNSSSSSRKEQVQRIRMRVRPCLSVCQSVEQKCPYMLPGDRAPAHPTQYAGEPTFLCLDPNIPETGEQRQKSSHGEEDCCYALCGTGLCSQCSPRSLKDVELSSPAPVQCPTSVAPSPYPADPRVSACAIPPPTPPPPLSDQTAAASSAGHTHHHHLHDLVQMITGSFTRISTSRISRTRTRTETDTETETKTKTNLPCLLVYVVSVLAVHRLLGDISNATQTFIAVVFTRLTYFKHRMTIVTVKCRRSMRAHRAFRAHLRTWTNVIVLCLKGGYLCNTKICCSRRIVIRKRLKIQNGAAKRRKKQDGYNTKLIYNSRL